MAEASAEVSSEVTCLTDPHADEINDCHQKATASAETAVDYAIRCGELLCAQKRRLKHGEWVEWIKQHCTFTAMTAQTYMRASGQKQRGLCFSSLSQLLAYDRGDKVLPPPRAEFICTEDPPDFELPPGHDLQQWAYAHQTAKRLRWFAKFIRRIDPLAVARGALPEEVIKLKPSIRQIHWFIAELRGALQAADFGLKPTALINLTREDLHRALWNVEAEASSTKQAETVEVPPPAVD